MYAYFLNQLDLRASDLADRRARRYQPRDEVDVLEELILIVEYRILDMTFRDMRAIFGIQETG